MQGAILAGFDPNSGWRGPLGRLNRVAALGVLLLLLLFCGISAAERGDLRLLSGAARQAARGDTLTALEVCDRFLSRPGRDETKPVALHLKGVLETGRGRLDTAAACFRQLIVEYPESDRLGRALTELGIIYNRQARDTAAVRQLETVAAYFPDSSFAEAALVTLARSAERCGLDNKALPACLQYLASPEQGIFIKEILRLNALLLYNAGRVEESYDQLQRLRLLLSGSQETLDQSVQTLMVGCLTGVGRPDSALALAQSLRSSSATLENSPQLLFMMGQAHLALQHLESADSAFSALAGLDSRTLGLPPDSLYALLARIKLSQGRYDDFFRYGMQRMEKASSPWTALELIRLMADLGRKTGQDEPVLEALTVFENRFGGGQAWKQAQIIRARFLAWSGKMTQALRVLDELEYSGPDSVLKARCQMARCEIYINAGDTLRAEAELNDYLRVSAGDPLNIADSLWWVYAAVKRKQGDLGAEASFLDSLTADYPASRFWEQARERLEELRLFELKDPLRAARELLDLYAARSGNVTPLSLAEVAAQALGDYGRAAAILQAANPADPNERLKLIEYQYLSGLNPARQGSVAAVEKIFQARRDLELLLSQEKDFANREEAVGLYLKIFNKHSAAFSAADKRTSLALLRSELGGLRPGQVRSGVLYRLGEEIMASVPTDTTSINAMLKADSARALWTEVIGAGQDLDLVGRASLSLAASLEGALFAGAQDSAAGIYKLLMGRMPSSRWALLAEQRLGKIYLRQEQSSLAYRVLDDWSSKNAYAAGFPEINGPLAEAAFLTGRYARACSLWTDECLDALDSPASRRIYRYHRVRALTALGLFAGASRELLDFRARYGDKLNDECASAAAVELYLKAGNYKLAEQYLSRVPAGSEAYPVANIFYLRALLDRGDDPDKVRSGFENFRDGVWSSLFGLDYSFEAYRGIMACYMAQQKPKKVSEARNDFRKRYPEKRTWLAELTLDEIEYLIASGDAVQAGALYSDFQLLFPDVCRQDRNLWVGARLALARNDYQGSGEQLESLAAKFVWSEFGIQARLFLAHNLLDAGMIDQAVKILDALKNLPPGQVADNELANLEAAIEAGRGRWDLALKMYTEQWLLIPSGRPTEKVLLNLAEAAAKAEQPRLALEILSGLWSPDSSLCAQARFLLGVNYQAAGDYDQALSVLKIVSEVFSSRTEWALRALYQQGLIQETMGRIEEAVATYRSLIRQAGQRSDWTRSARDRLRAIAPDS